MRFVVYFLTISCLITAHLLGSIEGASSSDTDKIEDVSEGCLVQMKLSNGMTVWLKPTSFESDEIFIKLTALGGTAELPSKDRFSGELAAQIAWESGMGGFSSDQISVLLYEHSLEFVPKIQPFCRVIEGTSGKEGLEAFLKCTHMLFTQKNFSREGWKAAKIVSKTSLSKMACDYDLAYEAAFLSVNTQGFQALQPMSVEDLDKVDFDLAKAFFQRCFSNPQGFVCVIVGSFDIDSAKALVNHYLGSIPTEEPPFNFNQPEPAPFPPGITNKEIHLSQRPDSLTRLTFPLQISLNEKSIHQLAFMCQVIEARLRRVITQNMKLSYGIDVCYEFPLYPLLDNPWISIRFRCDNQLVDKLKQIVIHELKLFQDRGVTQEEMVEIKKLEAGSDDYWLRDNFYWMSMLTNYYLWKWDPEWIYLGSTETKDLNSKTIDELLKTSFSLKNYSIITAKP